MTFGCCETLWFYVSSLMPFEECGNVLAISTKEVLVVALIEILFLENGGVAFN